MIWQKVDLSELIDVIESGGRPYGGASQDSGEIPSLGGENILLSGGLELEEVKKVPTAFYEQLTKGKLQDKDVLINKDGANTGKVGFYQNQFPKASINEHVFLLRGKEQKLDQLYLYYTLLSQTGQIIIRSKISGSAQPGLKRDFIKNFPVSVPESTLEQVKIAEVLVTIDRAIAQTEALIAKHQRIKAGLMQDLLTRGIDEHGQLRDQSTHKFQETEIGLIPTEWSVSTLSGITKQDSFICYGIVQPGKYFEGGIPVLAIRDMKGDYRTGIHFTDPVIDAQYIRSRVEPGDLLISVKGTTGRIDVVPNGFKGNLSRDIAKIRLSSKHSPKFYLYYFESFQGQKALDLISVGTTRKELSIAPLKELLVPVPDKKEQEIIVDVFVEKDRQLFSLREQHKKLMRIKTGLMQDLMSGRVSVKPLMEG